MGKHGPCEFCGLVMSRCRCSWTPMQKTEDAFLKLAELLDIGLPRLQQAVAVASNPVVLSAMEIFDAELIQINLPSEGYVFVFDEN